VSRPGPAEAPAISPGAAAAAATSAPSAALPRAPSLKRRLACFLYEGVLLFGVVMAAGLVYGVATQQRHALVGSSGLKVFLFVVLGLYFVYFWSRSGQTLAMLTWRLRVVGPNGQSVTALRAACRYVLSWLWFVPALATVYFAGLKGGWPVTGAVVAGVLAYAALTRLHPQRQYWHDAACGTRLVDAPAPPRPTKKAKS
jgi:uncharacterized RDD family membrane protein YckC